MPAGQSHVPAPAVEKMACMVLASVGVATVSPYPATSSERASNSPGMVSADDAAMSNAWPSVGTEFVSATVTATSNVPTLSTVTTDPAGAPPPPPPARGG
jgi:hypothetical protein